MTDDRQLFELYGPAAKFAEFKAGQTVRYRSDGRELVGEITYVSAPGHTVRGVAHPTQYWIDGLTCIYQSDILSVRDGDDQEPALEHCPHCRGWHQAGMVERCPQNRKRKS